MTMNNFQQIPQLDVDDHRIETFAPINRLPTGITISTSAPGKIILFGEHSVVYGKLALAASLGLRTQTELVEFEPNPNSSNTIIINLQSLNLQHSYDLMEINRMLLDKPLPLLKAQSSYNLEKPDLLNHEQMVTLVSEFVSKTCGSEPLNFYQKLALSSLFYLLTGLFGSVNIALKPFTLTVHTNLTISAGTGSSASYLVTLSAAFLQYIKTKSSRDGTQVSKAGYKHLTVSSIDLYEFNKKELELISKWAHCAEKIIHGSASGIDNTICTFGSMVEFHKGSTPKTISLVHNFRILLINTKVPKDTKRLVTKVATLRSDHPTIVDCILDAMDEVAKSALDCLTKINTAGLTEIVAPMGLKAHYDTLGELIDLNQGLLRALDVSHPKLDVICSRLKEIGLHGKLTGAGGGGYAIAVIPPHYSVANLEEIINGLNAEGFEAIATDLGGAGVAID